MGRDELSRVLTRHRTSPKKATADGALVKFCTCGEEIPTAGGLYAYNHRNHVADVLLPLIEADIREQVAQEIEAEAEGKPDSSPYLRRAGLYSAGLVNAARIARGATQ